MTPKKMLVIWPPIIHAINISLWIRMRDILLTAAAWLTLIYVLHDFWQLVFDYFSDPIFQLLPDQSPNWAELWKRVANFFYIAIGLITWIMVIGLLRRKIINNTKYIHSLPASIEMEELEIQQGLLPKDIKHWHELRSVSVFVNEESRINKITSNEEN